jgi:hypothetical protein
MINLNIMNNLNNNDKIFQTKLEKAVMYRNFSRKLKRILKLRNILNIDWVTQK